MLSQNPRMKKMFILLSVVLIIFVSFNSCAASRLQFLDEETKISYAAQYSDVQVLISKDGNCYIRGGWISKEKPFGLANARTYEKFIDQTFPFSEKLDRFVLMYDGGDAKNITLSHNGGVILTDDNRALLFFGTQEYRVPKLFCEGVLKAVLVDDRVYAVKENGSFGYYHVDDDESFIQITESIKNFETAQGIFMLHTNENEIIVTDAEFGDISVSSRISDVSAFSLKYVGNDSIAASIVKSDGSCFYQTGSDASKGAFQTIGFYTQIANNIKDVSVYKSGVLMVDENNNMRVYGNTLYGNNSFLNSEIIAENVCSVSGGMSSCFAVLNDGGYLYYGLTISGISSDFTEDK